MCNYAYNNTRTVVTFWSLDIWIGLPPLSSKQRQSPTFPTKRTLPKEIKQQPQQEEIVKWWERSANRKVRNYTVEFLVVCWKEKSVGKLYREIFFKTFEIANYLSYHTHTFPELLRKFRCCRRGIASFQQFSKTGHSLLPQQRTKGAMP